MRVYHFVNAEHGLDDIEKRRLKVARINELNDPFEFLGANLADKNIRAGFKRLKEILNEKQGLLCFSKNWKNPVQWSHYADRHKGLCLGFHIPDKHLITVDYSMKRLDISSDFFTNPDTIPKKEILKLFSTKFEHWKYEKEVRYVVKLNEKDAETDLYFINFSEDLVLKEIIIGAKSSVTSSELIEKLGDLKNTVQIITARLAFKKFEVVTQKNKSLWK